LLVTGYIQKLPDKAKAAAFLLRRADLAAANGQAEQAIEQYRMIVRDYADTGIASVANYHLAECQKRLGRYEEAIIAFQNQWQNYRQSEEAAGALYHGALLLNEMGEESKALHWLEKVNRDFAESEFAPQAVYQVGVIALQRGEVQKAEEYFNTLAQQTSDPRAKPWALLGQARVQFRQRQYRKAAALTEGLLNQADVRLAADAQYLLAEVYHGQEEYAKAAVAFLKIKYLYPEEKEWVAAGIFQAGQCNERLQRFVEARRLYQSLIQDFSDQPLWIKKVQDRLDALKGK